MSVKATIGNRPLQSLGTVQLFLLKRTALSRGNTIKNFTQHRDEVKRLWRIFPRYYKLDIVFAGFVLFVMTVDVLI